MLGKGTWKKLENTEWSNIYATSWVPGYSDIHLIIDRVSFDVEIARNWSYSLHASNGTTCGRPVSWLRNESLDLTFSLLPNATTLDPKQQSLHPRFMVNTTDFWDNGDEFPDLEWPSSYEVKANTSQTLRDHFELCPKDGWLRPTTAFHVQNAWAKVVPYANRVQVALPFLAIVIVSNMVKIIGIWFAIRMHSADHVITTGDAVATFLKKPELATQGKCTLAQPEICAPIGDAKPQPWQTKREFMINALGGARIWSATIM
jgi:hypothetical protein